ncbi:MAG: NAD-dependent dihydropyrimidine dehydrogenase subunit PreA [Firmicutes bacterium]|jgi:dihydropyrimidine dehydrogenase (NAD+) subunit PreA|nr:NAD-dependent dihydropyrimidine dehydrogenase subunit PreA [Bacillota bacterium]
MSVDLSISFAGIRFENPFTLAASPCTDSAEMVSRAFEAGWAGAVMKTTSVEEEVVELCYPMMAGLDFDDKKVVGLENIDLISERHIDLVEQDVRELKANYPTKIVGASIMGARKEHWQTLVRRLEAAGVDFIECSFSCPHGMPERGMGSTIGQDPELTERTARWVREAATRVPVVIKVTPLVADLPAIARAVVRSGAHAVCAINTVKSLIGVDLDTFVPYPNVGGKSTYGGYSGAAIKPIALRCVAEVAKAVNIPIAATGGITTWRDAAEFLLVGATNLQICTAVMKHGFRVIDDLIDGLSIYLEEKGLSGVEELVGRALPNIVDHSELSRSYRPVSEINLETCIKCDVCYISCRDGGHQAISLDENRLPRVDEEKCVGCGMCATVCPVWDCVRLVPR